jgi:hypothetical protein
MKTMMLCAAGLLAATAACGHEDEATIDDEACEHLTSGPFTNVTASAARDGTTPQVRSDHMAYTAALTAGAVGYVAFAAAEAADYVVFFDKPMPFQVQDAAGATIPIEASETSSPACAEIRGRHTVALPVGTAYFGLGPNMGMPVSLVVEEAAAHDEH